MEKTMDRAKQMLVDWKGDSYAFGFEVLDRAGDYAQRYGRKALLVVSELGASWIGGFLATITDSLKSRGIEWQAILGAAPNAPREDLYRISLQIARERPDMILAIGGGSTIDACKAANVLATFSPMEVERTLQTSSTAADSIDPFFGVGQVTRVKNQTSKTHLPLIAVQTAASSGAHLTKYSNITEVQTGQKKLIVDEALVPPAAVFDYAVTLEAPMNLTLDGGFDGIAHLWEVFMGATGQPYYERVKELNALGLRLLIHGLTKIKKDEKDRQARYSLGLGTDLGGYAIMIGGTSGPHLGSFSLIDCLSHGRACAVLNPYYTVLFAPRIEDQLQVFAEALKEGGFIKARTEGKKGRALAMLVARGMIQLSKSVGFPTTLTEAGVPKAYLRRMITAAKDPQLKMKLQNMPTPMEVERGDVDRLMKPTLEAAFSGDLAHIPVPS